MARTRRELLRDGAAWARPRWSAGRPRAAARRRGAAAARTAPYAVGLTLADRRGAPPAPGPSTAAAARGCAACWSATARRCSRSASSSSTTGSTGWRCCTASRSATGRVSYANRFLRSSAYDAWKREGRMKYSEFGDRPVPGDLQRRHVAAGARRGPQRQRVDRAPRRALRAPHRDAGARALRPAHAADARRRSASCRPGAWARRIPTTTRDRRALQLRARARRRRAACAWSPSGRPAARAGLRAAGQARLPALVRADHRYVAVFTQPFGFDLAKFLAPGRGPIVTNFGWDGSQPSRVVLVDRRRGGGVARDGRARSVLRLPQHQRVRRRGGRVVVDVCAHRDSSIVDAMYLKQPAPRGCPHAAGGAAAARRSTRRPGASRSRDLAEGNFELPRTDYDRVNGRPYRYAYGVGVKDPARSGFIDRLSQARHRGGER